MPEVYSSTLNQTIHVDRIIGRVDGKKQGPCLLFFGGIHGNEPSGVFALHQVIQELELKKEVLSGSCIAISGNLWALQRGVRYQKTDLNRLWTPDTIDAIKQGTYIPKNEDEKEQVDIFNLLQHILTSETGPFYFFDLHTTSSPTIPFITVNDSLLNRKFTNQYPIPLILGIEEYLTGPLLSYINELGYVSFGFEAGQHDELSSIKNNKIFIYLSLVFSGALDQNAVAYEEYLENWSSLLPQQQAFYEIYHRFQIKKKDHFKMKPGFSNFQSVQRNTALATLNGKTVNAKKKAIIFMPLYQNQGNDGYFFIRKIPPFFLWLSKIVRKYTIDRVFVILPGIRWVSDKKETMIVDLRIARFISKQLFHLFGYRSKQMDKNHLLIKNREYRSRKQEYANENWYKNNS